MASTTLLRHRTGTAALYQDGDMEYEQAQADIPFDHNLPEGCRWPDLRDQSGLNLLNVRIPLIPISDSGFIRSPDLPDAKDLIVSL